MKEKVSEFMDGELDQQGTANILAALKNDNELKQHWDNYHLIGDALRRSSRLSTNIASNVSRQLKVEPTILSPQTSRRIDNKQKYKVFAFAIAASVIAMVAGGVIMNHLYEPGKIMIAEQSKQDRSFSATPIMISSPPSMHHYTHPPVDINDYLLVHREFSSGSAVRGHISNVNNTPDYHERYGR